MIRSMIVGLAALGLASAVMAEADQVVIVPRAQFYHRAGHLEVDVTKVVPIDQAIANGYSACPECTPPKLVEDKLRDSGPSPYFKQLLANKGSGKVYTGAIPGRLPRTSELEAKAVAAQAQAQAQAPVGAAPVAVAPAPAPVLAPVSTGPSAPPPGQVPGTGGLLQALQFQNSGLVPTDVNYQGQAIK